MLSIYRLYLAVLADRLNGSSIALSDAGMGNLEGRPQFEAARMTGILSTDDIDVALVDEAAMLEALLYVSACEHCAENATIAFDYLLDAVTGCDPTETEYVMCRPATCPGCSAPITEKTRVVAD